MVERSASQKHERHRSGDSDEDRDEHFLDRYPGVKDREEEGRGQGDRASAPACAERGGLALPDVEDVRRMLTRFE